jgi:large subunit ribosomal protein L16
MLMSPRKFKFRKVQKGSIPNTVLSESAKINLGTYAVKAAEFGILTGMQLEAARKVIMKKIKKKGKLWVKVFPHLPKTKKPVEVRMGKGKGPVDTWVAKIRPGMILYEIEGISPKLAKEVFYLSAHKLPILCKLVERI